MTGQKTSVVAPDAVAALAVKLGLSNVARRANVCHQSVGKWAKNPDKVRTLVGKSIKQATLDLGKEIADLLIAANAQ